MSRLCGNQIPWQVADSVNPEVPWNLVNETQRCAECGGGHECGTPRQGISHKANIT